MGSAQSMRLADGKGAIIRPSGVVRAATAADASCVVEMALTFLRLEPSYRDTLPPDRSRVAALVDLFLTDADKTIFVSGGTRLTGVIAVLLGEHLFTGEQTVTEIIWWVDPSARGHGVRLLKAAEDWGRANGAVKLQMMAPSDRTSTLYERLGFVRLETGYQKVLT